MLQYLRGQTPPLVFLRYQVGAEVWAEAGNIPGWMAPLQGSGELMKEDIRLFWGPLPFKKSRTHLSDRYDDLHRRGGCLSQANLSIAQKKTTPMLVMGMYKRPPKHLELLSLQSILGKALLLLIAWLSILIAWLYNIRRRASELRLHMEQQKQKHYEDLSIAAAGLAHETKNPLGIIIGLAQQITQPSTPTADVELYADYIIDEAERATVRLSEFMSYAEWRQPDMANICIDDCFTQVCSILKRDFELGHIALRHTVQSPHASIRADEEMLKQILTNLLFNALQATERGGEVHLCHTTTPKEEMICVRDTGKGIESSLQAEIFKPYVTLREGGHGLGLALVKRMVDAHHWTISVESAPKQGTKMCIRISKHCG